MTEVPEDLPGAELVASGIDALRRDELTAEALLVAVGARRLRAAGLEIPRVPELPDAPEQVLYAVVGAARPREAHARYNGLIRRLVSFERALEHAARRETRPAGGGRREPRRLNSLVLPAPSEIPPTRSRPRPARTGRCGCCGWASRAGPP